MNSASHSAVPYRLATVAIWALAVACAVAWSAAVVYELQAAPEPRTDPSQQVSGPTGQAAAHPPQADGTSSNYWPQVGRAAGSL
ncbi:MAG TPA: hypothetical protein VNW98_08130 [Burkholderiaceae bacterium]|jgi:hypothetical protein|nr:hypothetical protein [Burkholderiaceae bacterium]